MQKSKYPLILKGARVNALTWKKFEKYLKDNNLKFSQWVREQIEKVIK